MVTISVKNRPWHFVKLYRIIPLVPAGIRRDFRVFRRSGNYTGRELNEKFLKNRIQFLLNFNYLINLILMRNRFRQSYPSTRHEPVCQHTAGLKSGLLHSFGYGKPFMSDGFNCQNSRRPLFRWLTI